MAAHIFFSNRKSEEESNPSTFFLLPKSGPAAVKVKSKTVTFTSKADQKQLTIVLSCSISLDELLTTENLHVLLLHNKNSQQVYLFF